MTEGTDSLTFAHPIMLSLLVIVPVLVVVKVLGDGAKERGVQRMVASGLRRQLVFGERPGAAWVLFAMEMLGIALIVAALARPQKGFTETETLSEGRNILIAVDTSRSMLATDLEPNRLERAKLAAQDLTAALPTDRVGVMAFAGSAYIQAPLTIDHSAVYETIEQLGIDSVERGGTNIASAIKLALERFEKNSAERHALVIFTDGDDLEGSALDAAELAAEKGVLIMTVGVGSLTGSIIPETETRSKDQFIHDKSGKLVKSRLDVEGLEKLAKRTNGMFINLNARSMNDDLVKSMLEQLDLSETAGRVKRVPNELYQWPLAAGLLMLTLVFASPLLRRTRAFTSVAPALGSTTVALLLLFALPPSANAGSPAAAAFEAYQSGDYEEAADLYQSALESKDEDNARDGRFTKLVKAFKKLGDPKRDIVQFGHASAAYKSGDYDTALAAFSETLLADDLELRERSHYNLGNTLFRRGEQLLTPPDPESSADAPPSDNTVEKVLEDWESSVQHYEDTLALNGSNGAAERNLEIVKRRIEQLKQQQEQQQQEQEKQEQDDEKEQQKDEKQENEESKQDDKNEQEKDKEQKDQEQKKGDEENKQNNEQKSEENEEKEENGGEDQKKEEGSQNEKQEESEQGTESDEKEEDSQNSDGEQKDEQNSNQEKQPSEPNGEQSEGDPKNGEKYDVISEDEQINPETGYSKQKAKQLLEALADEQLEIRPIKRRIRRGYYRDW